MRARRFRYKPAQALEAQALIPSLTEIRHVFTLNPLPPQLSPALVDKLVKAEPATIGHFRDWGFMDPGIKALQQDVRIAGPAVTIHQPGVDGTIIGYAMGQLRPGDVLVVDRCGDTRHAGFRRRRVLRGEGREGRGRDHRRRRGRHRTRSATTACRCGAAACPRSRPSASGWAGRSACPCRAAAWR